MNLYQLRYFIEVAKFGSLNKAAHTLHVNQSTLSKQIAALETELSTRLFDRTNLGIKLTENGNIALVHAKEIVEKQEGFLQLFRQNKKQHLKLGVLSSLAIFFLPSLVACLSLNDMSIEYVIQNSEDLEQSLENGLIDLFIGDRGNAHNHSIELFREHYKLIIGDGTPNELARGTKKLVITKRPCRTRELILPYLYRHNMNFSSYIEVDNVFIATFLVSSSLGFSIVPSSVACSYGGYSENIDDLFRDIYVVAQKDNPKGIRLAKLIKNLTCTAATNAGINHVCNGQQHLEICSASRARTNALI